MKRHLEALGAWATCVCLLATGFSACGGTKPEPAVTPAAASARTPPIEAAAPEPVRVLPELRTGTLEPVVVAEPLVGKLLGYVKTGDTETFKVALPIDAHTQMVSAWLLLDGDGWQSPASFVAGDAWSPEMMSDGYVAWFRRKAIAGVGTSLDATLLTRSYEAPAAQRRVIVPLEKPRSDPKLEAAYLAALGRRLQDSPLGPLLSKYWPRDSYSGDPWQYTEWSSLMRLASGYDSVEGALHANATLRLSADPQGRKVPLSRLTPPRVEAHPWAQMTAALGGKAPPEEALALATPAEFYFVRAASFDGLQRLLDELDDWVSAGVRLARGAGRRHDLEPRYRAQLGLGKSDLVRVLGPKLVRDLALVGSDPFLRQGSDVTLLIRPLDAPALQNTLTAKLAVDHPGGVKQSSFQHQGVTVTQSETADGALHQLVAHVPESKSGGALTVISNSPGALRRILDVAVKGERSLAAEPDFGYMLARDAAVPADVLVYFGDAFVRSAVSPRQRILDARRQLARAELSRLGNAALLFAWLEGRPPKDTRELLGSAWFDKKAQQHVTGEAITFDVGSAPRSALGTPAFMKPLIDLPTPDKVTEAEKNAYDTFANAYSMQWNEHLDPIAARLRVTEQGGKRRLEGHVRVLPVLQNNDYQRVQGLAGSARVATNAALPGAHVTLAIGEDSELRKELSGGGRSFLGRELELDWLGNWVTIGVGDEPALARALQLAREAPEVPEPNEERLSELDVLRGLPVYIALDIKRPGAAAVLLTLLRKEAQDSVPGLEWGPHGKRGETSIVRIKFEEVELYYALTKKRLFLSLDPALVETLVANEDAFAPRLVDGKASEGGQLTTDAVPRDPSGMFRALGWLIEHDLRDRIEHDTAAAEALLRGTPGATAADRERIALNYFGFLPVTIDGAPYDLQRTGVTDPVRGSLYRPVYPNLPVPGSLLAALLDGLDRVHVELGFDKEPGVADERSLRSGFVVERTR